MTAVTRVVSRIETNNAAPVYGSPWPTDRFLALRLPRIRDQHLIARLSSGEGQENCQERERGRKRPVVQRRGASFLSPAPSKFNYLTKLELAFIGLASLSQLSSFSVRQQVLFNSSRQIPAIPMYSRGLLMHAVPPRIVSSARQQLSNTSPAVRATSLLRSHIH